MNKHESINYIEFPARDLSATKTFFSTVFGWSFIDYGPEYTAFSKAGIDGGFFKSNVSATVAHGSALIVFYSHHLEQTQHKIKQAGDIIRAIALKPSKQHLKERDVCFLPDPRCAGVFIV